MGPSLPGTYRSFSENRGPSQSVPGSGAQRPYPSWSSLGVPKVRHRGRGVPTKVPDEARGVPTPTQPSEDHDLVQNREPPEGQSPERSFGPSAVTKRDTGRVEVRGWTHGDNGGRRALLKKKKKN